MTCRCGHDRLLHHELTGACLILQMTAPHPVGCGCPEYRPQSLPKAS